MFMFFFFFQVSLVAITDAVVGDTFCVFHQKYFVHDQDHKFHTNLNHPYKDSKPKEKVEIAKRKSEEVLQTIMQAVQCSILK